MRPENRHHQSIIAWNSAESMGEAASVLAAIAAECGLRTRGQGRPQVLPGDFGSPGEQVPARTGTCTCGRTCTCPANTCTCTCALLPSICTCPVPVPVDERPCAHAKPACALSRARRDTLRAYCATELGVLRTI